MRYSPGATQVPHAVFALSHRVRQYKYSVLCQYSRCLMIRVYDKSLTEPYRPDGPGTIAYLDVDQTASPDRLQTSASYLLYSYIARLQGPMWDRSAVHRATRKRSRSLLNHSAPIPVPRHWTRLGCPRIRNPSQPDPRV
jgi:hypothetical protein